MSGQRTVVIGQRAAVHTLAISAHVGSDARNPECQT